MGKIIIGSHVSMSAPNMLVGSVREALSYGANTFMFYTGAPQNSARKPVEMLKVEEARRLMEENNIDIENAIVMPNHIHLLITIDNIEARYTGGHGDPPLQDVIRNLKSYTTKKYWELTGEKNDVLWQRGFVDHIIRNQTDFEYHWNYIEYNALKEYK